MDPVEASLAKAVNSVTIVSTGLGIQKCKLLQVSHFCGILCSWWETHLWTDNSSLSLVLSMGFGCQSPRLGWHNIHSRGSDLCASKKNQNVKEDKASECCRSNLVCVRLDVWRNKRLEQGNLGTKDKTFDFFFCPHSAKSLAGDTLIPVAEAWRRASHPSILLFPLPSPHRCARSRGNQDRQQFGLFIGPSGALTPLHQLCPHFLPTSRVAGNVKLACGDYAFNTVRNTRWAPRLPKPTDLPSR